MDKRLFDLYLFRIHNLSKMIKKAKLYKLFISVYQKSLKQTFQNDFLNTKSHLLNFCSRVVKSQRLFCSQKAGVKCSYESFLVNKSHYMAKRNLIFNLSYQSFKPYLTTITN